MALMTNCADGILSVSVERLTFRVRWTHPTEPAPDLPALSTVQMAFTPIGVYPLVSDFIAGNWQGDTWSNAEGEWWLADIMIGPGQAVPLSPGEYWCWVRVVMGSQAPILGPFGPLSIL